MSRDDKFEKKVLELNKEIARIVREKVEAGRAQAAVTETLDPDCSLCDDVSWWEEEFGDLAVYARCQTCGPNGWGCPGEYCPSI